MQQIISYFQNDSKLFHEFLKKKKPKTNGIKCGCYDNHSCNDTEKQINPCEIDDCPMIASTFTLRLAVISCRLQQITVIMSSSQRYFY